MPGRLQAIQAASCGKSGADNEDNFFFIAINGVPVPGGDANCIWGVDETHSHMEWKGPQRVVLEVGLAH